MEIKEKLSQNSLHAATRLGYVILASTGACWAIDNRIIVKG